MCCLFVLVVMSASCVFVWCFMCICVCLFVWGGVMLVCNVLSISISEIRKETPTFFEFLMLIIIHEHI